MDGRGSGVFDAAPLYRPLETLAGLLGNFELLSLVDRLTLAGFLTAGLLEYFSNPAGSDQVSVRQKAEAYGVTENAIHNVMVPLTSRVIKLPADSYALAPGNDALRPPQATPIEGLTLAGDYTRQQYLATMEGAVVSEKFAADAVEAARRPVELPAMAGAGTR